MGYMRDRDGERLDSVDLVIPQSTDGPQVFFTSAGGNQELVSDDTSFYWGVDNGDGIDGTIYKINPATGATITTFTGPVHCAGGDYRRSRDTILFSQGGDNPPMVWEINKTTGAKIRQWDFTGVDYNQGGLIAWDDTVQAGDVIYLATGSDVAGVVKIRKFRLHDDGSFDDLGAVYDDAGTINFGRGQGMTCRKGRLYCLTDDPTYPTSNLRAIYRFSPSGSSMVVDRKFSYYDLYESEGITFHQGALYCGNRNHQVLSVPWQPVRGQQTVRTLTVLDKLNVGNLPHTPLVSTTNSRRLASSPTDPGVVWDNTLSLPAVWSGSSWVTLATAPAPSLSDYTLIDTFTDGDMTNISYPNHLVDVGGQWQQLGIGPVDGAARSPFAGISGNRATSNSATTSSQVFRNTAVPASADFDVEWDAGIVSTTVGFWLVLARMTPTGSGSTSTIHYYAGAIGNASTPGYVIGRKDSGTNGVVLSTAAAPPTVGTHRMRFRGVGSDLRLFVDGVQVAQATDSTISQVGRYGISVPGSNSGWIDNLRARATPAPISSTTVATLPALVSGQYYVPLSPFSATTQNTLGIGTLRVTPWVVNQTMTLTRLAAEVTAAGEAGSKVRLGIYADNGSGYPGALIAEGLTQLDGNVVGTQEVTVSAALTPGVYWLGGAVQSVTTTQPTLRTITNWTPPIPLALGTSLPSANITITGYSTTGVTGALPATYPAGAGIITACLRPIVKVA